MKSEYSPRLPWLIAGTALMTLAPMATPGLAQSGSEDITVTGRYGQVPDNVRSLSQTVSYADLDLGTIEGQQMLRHRVKLTARYLCDKLGESDTSGVVPSCRSATTQDALNRVGTVEAHLAPRGTTWVAGPPWHAPYPESWDTTYP